MKVDRYDLKTFVFPCFSYASYAAFILTEHDLQEN